MKLLEVLAITTITLIVFAAQTKGEFKTKKRIFQLVLRTIFKNHDIHIMIIFIYLFFFRCLDA